MGKNRDRLSIIASILEAANPESSKTNIMLSANLSFSLLEKYLDIVGKAGFIVIENSRYKLTERGREFLNSYKSYRDRCLDVERMFNSLVCEREKLMQFCEEYTFHRDK